MNKINTQLYFANLGEITSQMQSVAETEGLKAEQIKNEMVKGRLVIPANINHKNLKPAGVGTALKCKINANIGGSSLLSTVEDELKKLNLCIQLGADTVMDLSTGDKANEIREAIIKNSPLPVGTVPIYQVADKVDNIEDIEPEFLIQVIEEQAKMGVDFMTIHCGLLREHLNLALNRLTGIVSRGGSIMATWMLKRKEQNPLYTHFNDILEICKYYDVTLSLGDGLRPGCLADASDSAQFAELETLGELTRRCWENKVQVMIEGPGHIPLDEIAMNVERQQEVCLHAPFYVLGPVVTDIAPGYDHISSAIGAAVAAFNGASLLCYVTPREHLGLPDLEDVRQGIIAYKIAAHAADVACHKPGARDRDDKISKARAQFQWENVFSLSLDPQRSKEMFKGNITQSCPEKEQYCTMCGPKFCAMRLWNLLKQEEK